MAIQAIAFRPAGRPGRTSTDPRPLVCHWQRDRNGKLTCRWHRANAGPLATLLLFPEAPKKEPCNGGR